MRQSATQTDGAAERGKLPIIAGTRGPLIAMRFLAAVAHRLKRVDSTSRINAIAIQPLALRKAPYAGLSMTNVAERSLAVRA